MEEYEFEWDRNKAITNIKKHGISFEEAKDVFYDEYALMFDDPEHSISEDRYNIIGESKLRKVLIVCYCFRNNNIRIISSRKATPKERNVYLKYKYR